MLQTDGILTSSNELPLEVIHRNHTGIKRHVTLHLNLRCIVHDTLDDGGLILGHAVGSDGEEKVTVGDDVIIRQLHAIVPIVENQVIVTTVGIEQEHLIVDVVDDGIAHAGLTGPSAEEFAVTPSIQAECIPTRLVVDEDVVLRNGNLGQFTLDGEVVDSQRHCTLGSVTASHADVPCQIQVATACELGAKHSVHRHGLAGHFLIADGLAVGSKVGVEVVTCIGPVASVDGVIELYGKACGVVALAVLLDIVADVDVLDVLLARIEQVGIDVDAASAVSHTGRDTTQSTVTTGIVAEVPCAVFGIAGQADATTVHRLVIGHVIAAHGARCRQNAVDAPSLGQSGGSLVTHHIKRLAGVQH